MTRDHSTLLSRLAEEYARHSPRSAALHARARQSMIDGGSHPLGLIRPFPPRLVRAQGAYVEDADGHRLLDLWQGHYANLLGHNPSIVTTVLAQALASGTGLQTGFTDELQIEVAELLCARTGSERLRFTTSGALATLNAIMLARAFTGRELVLKVGGGWHGAQPWGLVGVDFHGGDAPWGAESAGLPGAVADEVVVTRYNDPGQLEAQFRRQGDRLACFILEPLMGAGGFMLASGEYLATARRLADEYGVVLIFDEVISGFRFRAGDLGSLYGIRPDLVTLAKVVGGGMPLAAVGGRADILRLCARGGSVRFPGGTYARHPTALLAAKTLLAHLIAHEDEIYPRLADLGALARRTMEEAFAAEGVRVRCTGQPNEVVRGSSLAVPHFPLEDGQSMSSPDEVNDPARCDVILRDQVLQLALLLEDVHVVHGGGALSTAHSESDVTRLGEACRGAARRVKPYL
jgi:glutamate-1-semialdehyde 2,1-aminomutase